MLQIINKRGPRWLFKESYIMDNLRNKVTIVIPTHNRPKHLKRAIEYWKESGFKIIIADSSLEKFESCLPLNISYYYLPKLSFISKQAMVLRNVETKYTLLCAVDDFVTEVGVRESCEFLEHNLDYAVAQGRFISFCPKPELQPNEYEWRSIYKPLTFDQALPSDRIFNYMSNYRMVVWWGVYRTVVLQKVWETTAVNTDDVRFGEILSAMLSAISGKIKTLDILYSAREREFNSKSEGGHLNKTIPDFIRDGSYGDKYDKFKHCLLNAIVSEENITKSNANKLIDKAMNNHLSLGFPKNKFKREFVKLSEYSKILRKCILAYQKLRAKTNHQSELENLNYFEYDNPKNHSYKDFIKIKEAISKNSIY